MEIPADENTPDIPDQDESETPEPSDSDIEAPLLPKSRKKRLTQIQRTSRLLKKFLPKKRLFLKKARFPTMRKRFL